MNIVYDYLHNLDLDRLHYAINYPWRLGRGEGKTFSFVAQMVGEAQLGDFGNIYLYIGENAWHCRDVAEMVREILIHEGLSVTFRGASGATRITLFVGNEDHLVKCFRFVSAKAGGILDHVRGQYFEDVYVDLTHESQRQLDPEIWHIIESRKK